MNAATETATAISCNPVAGLPATPEMIDHANALFLKMRQHTSSTTAVWRVINAIHIMYPGHRITLDDIHCPRA